MPDYPVIQSRRAFRKRHAALLGAAAGLAMAWYSGAMAQAATPAPASRSVATEQPLAGRPGRRVERRLGRKNVLLWIDSRSLMQSHAAATVERLGYETGLYDTFIRTDAAAAIPPDGAAPGAGADLEGFDAIFFLGSREADLSANQRAELAAFVRSGKGFVAAHAGVDAFKPWVEFGELLGGRLDGHPWDFTDMQLAIENPAFPGLQSLPRVLTRTHDETYEIRDFSRAQIDVLLRLDARALDMSKPRRKDGDYPMAWAKMYGEGRVYVNTLGHAVTDWDQQAIQQMFVEGLKWTLGLSDTRISPHPMVQVAAPAGGR